MRYQDWPMRLKEVIHASETKPFAWGEFDCCLFAADCVLATIGVDVAADWRGTYDSRESAAALLASLGGAATLADSVLPGRRLPYPMMAQRGDVVLIETPDGQALGICAGRFHLLPAPIRGLIQLKLARAITAWRVD